MPQALPMQGLFMDVEREKGDRKPLNREEARKRLAEAWLNFWSGSRTLYDTGIREDRIDGVLERLSPSDKEYFVNNEEGQDSELAKIREEAKMLARTGKKGTLSAGERIHIRREKAAKRRGTDPKRIH